MKKVEVKLIKSKGSELLRFGFDTSLEIELLSDNAQNLKDFFRLILEQLFVEEFELEFIPEVENDLYTEVSKKYVALLDNEIKTIRNQLPKE
jgi:hypothetical protein